jgi:uncharacterized repeat protein (TIGR01451 family)
LGWRQLAALLIAAVLALWFVGAASAAEPVDMGSAHDYSVFANTLTSNGPTAMSDNLGVSPGATFGGDTAPIVLGETHLGDSAAAAAASSFDHAYGDAVVRPSAGTAPADLAGASLDPGVYNATGATGFTAGGVLTLDAHGDRNAVFIFQVGGALTVGANAEVKLVGEADACNVFWAVGAAAGLGANSKFAGTLLVPSGAVTIGAGSRVDGRVMGGGAVTLSGNAIRTACSETIVVPGPEGPRGPAGADGVAGVQGIQGDVGADGRAGNDGLDGADGLDGTNGIDGLQGSTGAAGTDGTAGIDGLDGTNGHDGAAGATGATGFTGPIGLTGPTGLTGSEGPAGSAAEMTSLCVTKKASRRKVRRGGLVRWTIVVSNCGVHSATGVRLTDRLHHATLLPNGGGTRVGGRLEWQAGTLAAGASAAYRITTRLTRRAPLGRYVNRATVGGDNARTLTGSGAVTVVPRR